MPVCIFCSAPLQSLFVKYKESIQLIPCPRCAKFADKYIEHDLVVIFIDMVLHKPQVYRHLLFNRLKFSTNGINVGVMRFGILLVLFDVYMKWFRIDRMNNSFATLHVGVHIQYIYMLTLCSFGTYCLTRIHSLSFIRTVHAMAI